MAQFRGAVESVCLYQVEAACPGETIHLPLWFTCIETGQLGGGGLVPSDSERLPTQNVLLLQVPEKAAACMGALGAARELWVFSTFFPYGSSVLPESDCPSLGSRLLSTVKT